jgi:integrase
MLVRRRSRPPIPLEVVSTVLETGEGLPILVRKDTWEPASLALRWTVYARRHEAAESTLRGNLSALRYLYAWGDQRFDGGLEQRLAIGALEHAEIADLKEYLRQPDSAHVGRSAPAGAESPESPAVVGARALAALLFLRWALSPANRNDAGAEPADLENLREQLDTVLGPLAKLAGGSTEEREVPTPEILDEIEDRIRPLRDASGRFFRPLRWHKDNPFAPEARLRNWLMWQMARDCGPRVGELLKVKMADIQTIDGEPVVVFRRRPDDPEDTRRVRPSVKTLTRPVPVSAYVQFAHQAYLRESGAGGRRRGSPYLLTTVVGQVRPLSTSGAQLVMQVIARATGHAITWHDLRHAWATEIARHVLSGILAGKQEAPKDDEAMKALLVEQLRLLGGWADTSKEPHRYARTALRELAHHTLRAMQERRAANHARQSAATGEDALRDPFCEEDHLPWE